jgi:hypothetical protein
MSAQRLIKEMLEAVFTWALVRPLLGDWHLCIIESRTLLDLARQENKSLQALMPLRLDCKGGSFRTIYIEYSDKPMDRREIFVFHARVKD